MSTPTLVTFTAQENYLYHYSGPLGKILGLNSAGRPCLSKPLRYDALHALLVNHRTTESQQGRSQLNRSLMKVMRKSSGEKQNGSMAYRQQGTYWSRQGAQDLLRAW